MIDAAVRAKPEAAYDYAELFAGLTGTGAGQLSGQPGQGQVTARAE